MHDVDDEQVRSTVSSHIYLEQMYCFFHDTVPTTQEYLSSKT